MPDKREVMMAEAVFAFAQGCGGTEISDDAFEWFIGRYSAWLDSRPKKPAAAGKRPQDVWATEGLNFRGRFKKIGRLAAEGGGTIGPDAVSKAAQTVESQSDCPFCPDI